MANKKEYTIKINGVAQNIKDITKLSDTLNALDANLAKTREATVKADTVTKSTTKALNDEEKAAKKLADTQKRIADANSEANRAQIAANIELRERTREVTRNIAINGLAEGSIKEMGMQLTDLRNEYEELTAAQRIDEAQGGRLITQIQALDAEYKALRESTGNFRDSVGNYEKGFKGLNELKDKFELAARGSVNLAADVAGSNDALDAFGATTDTVAKSSEQLAGVMALATVAQEAYNAITKENIIQEKSAAVVEGVRTLQLKAKTAAEALSTKGTIAATVAQGIFNIVAAANPYVLLALALIAIGGLLFAFAGSTDKAAESQAELNAKQSIYLDQLDAEAAKLKTVSDKRVSDAETDLAVLTARGAKVGEIRTAENRLAGERAAANAAQRGFYGEELANLDKNRAKIEQLTQVLNQLNKAKAEGQEKIKIDIDLDGKVDKVKIEDAVNSVQGAIDNLGRSVSIAVDLNAEKAKIEAEAKVAAATRIKADKDLAKERKEKAQATQAAELAAVRAGEDARIKLIANSYEQARRTVVTQTKRDIEDLKIRLATEKNLTVKAREAINANIKSLEALKNKDLKALSDERTAKEIETQRQLEDSLNGLIIGEMDKRRAEINAGYTREVADLQKRLDTEKDLTANQQADIRALQVNAKISRDRELAKMNADYLNGQAAAELAALDSLLNQSEAKIGEVVVRNKDAFKLIDPEATRKNYAAVNAALAKYVTDVQKYQGDLKTAHEATLATLKKGTPEYEAEVQRYTDAQLQATQRITGAQKEQVANTKAAKETQMDYYRELGAAVTEYAGVASELTSGLVDTVNMGIGVQLDDMTARLDVINEKYEAAKAQREEAAKNVEDIEAQIQTATGGTAEALKSQLADAMAGRNELAREEKRLAKEKEKLDADIAKKEKQMKRNDLISNIAGAIANTAQGVTKALSLVFPLNLVVAGLVGAMGIAQVGIMTKQLTKLAKGGPIVGPSHSNGGVDIGLGYEAEGGEFMINKTSYAANPELVEFINKAQGPVDVTAAPGQAPPVVVIEAPQNSNDKLIDAIANMTFTPVVAVTDIIDATDQLTEVKDLAGF